MPKNNPQPSQLSWPSIPQITTNDPQAKVKEILYQAKVDIAKARLEADLEAEKLEKLTEIELEKARFSEEGEIWKSSLNHEFALDKAVRDAYVEIAKGQLDRIQQRADYVQKAAAAITTLYTGVLTVVFAVGENPLPARGLVPTVFLGLAIAFSAFYFAFVSKPEDLEHRKSTSNLNRKQRERIDRLILWSGAPALRRRYAMQVAVLCLGAGAVFLPAAFLGIANWVVFLLGAWVLLMILLTPAIISFIRWLADEFSKK